jgi:hypothetical protein
MPGDVVRGEMPALDKGRIAGVAPAIPVAVAIATVITVIEAVIVAVAVTMLVAVPEAAGGVTPSVRWTGIPADMVAGVYPNHIAAMVRVTGLPDPTESGMGPVAVVMGEVSPGFVRHPGPADTGVDPAAVGVGSPAGCHIGLPDLTEAIDIDPLAIAGESNVVVYRPVGIMPAVAVHRPVAVTDCHAKTI